MRRWLRIAARTLHLGAMAFVLVGAVQPAIPPSAVSLLLLSGGYLVADSLWRHGTDVFRFLHFWVVAAKLVLLLALLAAPSWAGAIAIAALVLLGLLMLQGLRGRFGAAARPPGTSPRSSTTSTAPTSTTSPSPPLSSTTVPAFGDGISTVALSVITSTRGWSSATDSPIATFQETISPSTTPSPMSGSLKLNMLFAPIQ